MYVCVEGRKLMSFAHQQKQSTSFQLQVANLKVASSKRVRVMQA